jgi:GNAT superfamily N-acetyltransferase
MGFRARTKSRATRTSAARESGSANLAAAAEEQARAQHDPHTLLVLKGFRWNCGPRPEIVVAMSRYRSEVSSAASLDRPAVARLTAISNATQALDAPAAVPFQADSLRLELLHGWDDRLVDVLALALDGEEAVGWGAARFAHWDNPTIAELTLDVHPDYQRRGIGTELLELLRRSSGERGRGSLDAYGWAGTDSEQFLPKRGFRVAQRGIQRRIDPATVDWSDIERLFTDATRLSEAYELVPLVGPTPPDMVDDLVDVWAAINDAPLDDLQADPEEDTTVVASHRGHRLGVRLKTAMLQWLREAEPGLTIIDTWNAVSNIHMIAVNDAIGCRAIHHGIVWQTYTERR